MIRYNAKKRWALVLVIALVMGFLPGGQMWGKAEGVSASVQEMSVSADLQSDYGLSNPTMNGEGVTTWDCVWFGNYLQSDATGATKEPVKWRVLSVDGDDAFLLADKNLDCKRYHTTNTGVTWETCTMRSWLNGYGAGQNKAAVNYSSDNFLDHAFTVSEQAAIKKTEVVTEDNPQYSTEGGYDTTDKVYVLSIREAAETKYGFASDGEKRDSSRWAKGTAYAKKQGAMNVSESPYTGNGFWWLRSPGYGSAMASAVEFNGRVNQYGGAVQSNNGAVRPALHLNLSSTSVWSKAGTVSSSGEISEIPPSTPTPTPVVTQTPVVTAPSVTTQTPVVTATPVATPTTTQSPKVTVFPSLTPPPVTTPTPAATASPDPPETLPPPTSTPSLLPASQPPMHKMKVTIKGNGVTTVRTNQVYVSTEQMAELTVDGGDEAIFTFIPEEGCSFISVTVDGQKQEFEGETYTIPHIGQDHDILVEFTEKMPLPTQSPEPTEVPPPQTEKPAPVSTPHPTATPMPVPAKSPVPSKMPPPDNDLSAITDGLGVSEETAIKIQAAARELNVSQNTILVTEQMIQSQKTDEDIKGSYFTHIQARASQITQKNIKLSWNRVKGADGYEIYGNRCNTKKWIYEYKKMKTIENGNKKSFIDRNCKKGTYYKYIVRAYKIIDGKKVTIAASKTIHVTTTGGKNGNAKSVKVNKKKVSLKVGKKIKLRAWEIKADKPIRHHREVSYESGDPNVATVSKKGRIKAKKKGKCTIFAYAQSGVFRKIKVTVK